MSRVASMLGKLRTAGVSIRSEGGRLIVEARAGVVTPEMRAELARCKAELVAALEPDIGYLPSVDPITAEAFREVAGLLAVAYQGYTRMPRVPVAQANDSAVQRLALSEGVSVHGHGHVP